MEKMSRADMQIKVRTPIGLLLVLCFVGKWILDTFEEGRMILDNLPPVLGFLARPLPSIVFLIVGVGLILWELHGIRKTSSDPQKRQLRHYLIGSGISFLGLLIIVAVVVGVSTLLKGRERKAERVIPPTAINSPSITAASKTDESKADTKNQSAAQQAKSKKSTASPSSMSQACAPGASCGQSSGQQGGITVGTVNIGPQIPPTSGYLEPANDDFQPVCHNPGPMENANTELPDDAVAVYLGDNRFPSIAFPYSPLTYKDKPVFTIDRDYKGRVAITVDIRSKDGKIVTRIEHGKFVVNPNNILSMEHPDKSTLIVMDQEGNEVLNVRYRNRRVIHFVGTLYLEGKIGPLIISDDEINSGGFHYKGMCSTYNPGVYARLPIH